MIVCSNCGQQTPEGMNYCMICGYTFPKIGEVQSKPQNYYQPPVKNPGPPAWQKSAVQESFAVPGSETSPPQNTDASVTQNTSEPAGQETISVKSKKQKEKASSAGKGKNNVLLYALVGALSAISVLAAVFLLSKDLRQLVFGAPYSENETPPTIIEVEMTAGDTKDLTYYLDLDGVDLDDLSWSTSDVEIASVNNGVVEAQVPGDCLIYLADANGMDTGVRFHLTVYDAEEQQSTAEPTPASDDIADVRQYSFLDHGLPSVSPSDVFPNVYLDGAYLSKLNAGELQYLINLIYAKNGYIFDTDATRDYFPRFPWYSGYSKDMDVIDGRKSLMDRENVDLIADYRVAAGYDTSIDGLSNMWTYRVVNEALSGEFLSNLSDYDLVLLADTILAKNGYIFSDPMLSRIFQNQSWYSGSVSDLGQLSLSDLDIQNLTLIHTYLS